MIANIADYIVSPLGYGSQANYEAVKAGCTMLRRYDQWNDVPEPFTASLMDWAEVESRFHDLAVAWHDASDYTRFEQLCLLSIAGALAQTGIDVASPRVLLVFSTTKGNVELLDSRSKHYGSDRVLLGVTASKIARFLGNRNVPIVVSNACISGLCAQITAMRALESGRYDYAVVTGADVQSRFIISGFQSFKALSPVQCKPFDRDRQGLNLGEGAATIIYKRATSDDGGRWAAARGAIRNDANHISGPSRTGEGSYRALRSVLAGDDTGRIALVNCHGTATLYNDEMESIAIERAGLIDVPVNTLKGYYGHTMGAAGVLEAILSMHSLDDHTLLATRGFEHLGVSRPVNVSNQNRATAGSSFVKLLSGFGGCNAAILYKKLPASPGQDFSTVMKGGKQ